MRIRALSADDAPAILAAVGESRPELRRWMSWYSDDYGLEDAETWLQQALVTRDAATSCHFAICDTDARLRGIIGLEDIGPPGGEAMIGYWVATPATGRGLGTSAVRDVLAWARANAALGSVWAIVAVPNVASRRVLEANSFQIARNAEPGFAGDAQLIYEVPLDTR